MTIILPPYQDWINFRAHSHPNVVALEFSNGEIFTYAELDSAISKVTFVLNQNILDEDYPVAVLTQSSLEFSLLLHAIPRLGMSILPLNLRLKYEELLFQLREVNVRNLIVDEDHYEIGKKLAGNLGINLISSELILQNNEYEISGSKNMNAKDVHSIIYTSGTTGNPKAVMLTNENYYWSAVGSGENLGVNSDDRWLLCMPYYHIGGLSILMRSAIYGTSAVIHDGFNQQMVNFDLRKSSITLLSVVPTMLKRMLEFDTHKFPDTIRAVLVGGGPVSKTLLQEAQIRGLPVLQTYGLTEATSQISTLSSEDAIDKIGSAGKVLSINTLRIKKKFVENDVGEILVKGPTVTSGYLAQPDATQKIIVNGWLHTGDIGHLDEDGYLFISDRRDDLIVSGGENIYPAEIENVLANFKNVFEVAVVGFTDDEWGEKVVAVMVLNEKNLAIDVIKLKSYLSENLASYKHPRKIFIIDEELPRTASGKLQRYAVRMKFENDNFLIPIDLDLF
ncbi:MAG: o-succinylbenzoate--CoA ligase [Chloroflexi bacterium]|nr:o-succinylbenzoate--CoA ligase [Chloroflexota bacterium]